jgi:hypothetical protein
MTSALCLVLLLQAAPPVPPAVPSLGGEAAAPKPPKKVVIRPYNAPKLDPDPEPAPSTVQVVEVRPPGKDVDITVYVRPWNSQMVGSTVRGARLPVRGEYKGKNGMRWFAVQPFGWVISRDVKVTKEPATMEPVMPVAEGRLVPYRYMMVGVKQGTFLPMWATLEDLKAGAQPERQLKPGDSVAVRPKLEKWNGDSYYVAVDDKVVPAKGVFELRDFSKWVGMPITDQTHLPFGWVTLDKAQVWADAERQQKTGELKRRDRVEILEEKTISKGRRMLRVADNQWVAADAIGEVRKIDRPKDTGTNQQWVDVDLGEQVLVAYEGDKPVYATLTSSGRPPNTTPRGNYPMWGKVAAITMKSQPYDDIPYYVNKVPWVLFFQAHNALHGAYWHDRFGQVKSHGCVNLSPLDARHMFEWAKPELPAGWDGLRFYDLTQSPVVHVHNTHVKPDLKQERNIGPPDKRDEADRLEDAMNRREAAGMSPEAAAAGGVPGPLVPPKPGTPAPAPGAPAPAPGAPAPGPGPVGGTPPKPAPAPPPGPAGGAPPKPAPAPLH